MCVDETCTAGQGGEWHCPVARATAAAPVFEMLPSCPAVPCSAALLILSSADETPTNQRLAKELVERWSRPILAPSRVRDLDAEVCRARQNGAA